MFNKDKDYVFSFNKYREDCAKQSIQMGSWAQACNGAKVLIKRDRTEGLIHGDVVSQGVTVMVMGKQMRTPGNRERVCYRVEKEWCDEK